MFLSVFIHFNYLLQTFTQSFYIALSQNSTRESQAEGSPRRTGGSLRNIFSAGVLFIRRCNNCTCGWGCKKKLNSKNFFRNSLTVLKSVTQFRKRVLQYLITLRRTIAFASTLPIALAYLNTCIPNLNTCITYLNTFTSLSALGSIS